MSRVPHESYASRIGGSITSSSGHADLARLDLRAPANVPAPSAATTASPAFPWAASLAFPSARRTPGRTLGTANDLDQLPALGADGLQMKTTSRPEEIVRRVHREGIPVARLWENHSVLVSLGLNQRGKPGLWFIQKVK
jgi:hypothetical protein